jgi:hypothetical protein
MRALRFSIQRSASIVRAQRMLFPAHFEGFLRSLVGLTHESQTRVSTTKIAWKAWFCFLLAKHGRSRTTNRAGVK